VEALTRGANLSHSRAAKAAVLPMMYSTRFVAGWAASPTSVASPFTASSVDVTVDTTGAYLGGGSYFAAVSRDPLNAIIEYVPNPSGLSWYYSAKFSTTLNTAEAVSIHDVFMLNDSPKRVPFAYIEDKNIGDPLYLHPNGAVSFAKTVRTDTQWRALWFDKGVDILFSFFTTASATSPRTTAGIVEIYRWDGSDFVFINESVIPGTVLHVVSPDDAGWYAFAIKADLGIGPCYCKADMFQTRNLAVGAIGHRPIPGILDRTTITGLRVNGASVMLTPDSSELSKGGLCVGCQLPNAYQIEGFIQNAGGGKATDTLLTLKGNTQMNFEKGIYGWHKSFSEDSYELQTPMRFNIDYAVQTPDGSPAVQSVASYVSYMDPPDGWVACACSTPLNVTGGSIAYPGGVMHTTWSWSVEYMTNDVWIGASLPALGSSEYDDVMQRLARCPQFMENSFHIRDLTAWLRSNFNAAGRDFGHFIRAFGPDMQNALAAILKGADYIAHKAEHY
jgi:hypothetical protein